MQLSSRWPSPADLLWAATGRCRRTIGRFGGFARQRCNETTGRPATPDSILSDKAIASANIVIILLLKFYATFRVDRSFTCITGAN